MKTKLKINNPQKINTKNICLDKSVIEINYAGWEDCINASDKKPYMIYKFEAFKNGLRGKIVKFHIHTTINDNKVQFNIWKNGGMELNSLTVDVIKDRNQLINRMIAEVNKY